MANHTLRSATWLRNGWVRLGYDGHRCHVSPRGLVTTGQAARLLRVSDMTIYRMVEAGALKVARRDPVARFRVSDLSPHRKREAA